MSEITTPAPSSSASTPPEESPWQDDPSYPHRIENHVKVYLHLEETAAGLEWVVSPVTIDGYPLDGVEDGNYCDYEGHPPGARPDWDRQHQMAKDLHLPTAAELLPILASALGTSVEGPTVDQLRAASDLLAEHDEWRRERADLSAGESVGDFPDASDWHASDDAGCDLADRAIALLAELTGQTSHAGEGSEPGTASDVWLQRSMLREAPPTTASSHPDHTADATSAKRSGSAR
ncbi:MAG TPA: hypothetical protein PLZ93_05120 [Nocardioides sp.]|jgi:hypothetical protein|uniref:hypothetical protein n=1 Tax=uncultured Nocardioides sp. TaxID=198441 RepID=UPI000ECB0625|nr:hypothetical protein [uncultured Nocardioides sp.]HCB07812.1 hypothetical protein [Nocardioides sp.]HRD59496.1 hypothetical protein [Nocardioides sp.]HRI94969.1 hypothetical protein [Nocardioides sp.]HRK44830.1 hypothetical protein [Nocardioides sp.]